MCDFIFNTYPSFIVKLSLIIRNVHRSVLSPFRHDFFADGQRVDHEVCSCWENVLIEVNLFDRMILRNKRHNGPSTQTLFQNGGNI